MNEPLKSGLASTNALHQIRQSYDQLRQSEKKVANLIFEDPEKVMSSSISEVAQKGDISDATIIRFCKASGFLGFQDLKLALARSPTEFNSPKIFESISKNDTLETVIEKVFSNNMYALNETLQNLDLIQLKQVAKILNSARIIFIYGVGISGMVAEYASYRLTRMGLTTKAYVDSHSIALSTATVKRQDVVLTITQSGSTKEIVEALEIVKKRNILNVSVTGYPNSPAAKTSDMVLQNAVSEAPFESGSMPSLLAQLSVIDALMACTALEDFDRSIEMIQSTAEAVKSKKY